MKIGFNARFFSEPNTGLGQFSLHLIRSLILRFPDNIFLLYLPDNTPCPDFPGNNWKKNHLPGIRRKNFDRTFTKHPGFLKEKPDVLHIPHLKLPDEKQGIPLLLTIHDLIPAVFLQLKPFLSGKTPWKAISALGLRSRLLDPYRARQATMINTISRCSAKDIARLLHYPEEQIVIIPNGFNPELNPGSSPDSIQSIKKKYGITNRFIINFGGQSVRKNLTRQMKAFCAARKSLSGLQMLVTGEGHWQQKMIKKHIPGLLLPGKIPAEEMKHLISAADLSLYLSLYEGFGLPVLESIACGTPMLTSRDSAMSEILPEGCVFLDPLSTRSISRTLLQLLHRPDLLKEKVRAAQPGLKNYTWERAAEQYMVLYRKTAASASRG